MKFKLTINVETDAENQNLNITYKRKDIIAPDSVEEKLMAKYIETLVRYTIDNGFKPLPKEKLPNTKGDYDGDTVDK